MFMNPTKLNALPNFWMRFLHPLLEPRSLYKERFLLVFLFSASLALTLKAIPEDAGTTFSAARDRRSCCGRWGHPKSRTSASTGCSLTRTKAPGVVTHQHRSVLAGRTPDRLKDLLYPNCLEFTSFTSKHRFVPAEEKASFYSLDQTLHSNIQFAMVILTALNPFTSWKIFLSKE